MLIRVVIGTSLLIASAATFPAFGADAGDITPRTPLRKRPTASLRIPVDATGRVVATGNLVVKFNDSVRARAPRAGAKHVSSLSRENMSGVDEILAEHGLTIRQAINKEASALAQLQQRAVAHSQRAQPDLAGLMFVQGPLEALLDASRELNELPSVEFVYFEEEMITHRLPAPSPMPAPAPAPMLLGGTPPACGEAAQDCYTFDPDNPPGAPNCSDANCCELVGSIDPFCTDDFGEWDQLCTDLANLYCMDGDRCAANSVAGGCFDAHNSPGCATEDCCNAVCDISPVCCQLVWDDPCVILAQANCLNPGDGPSPDFSMTSATVENRLQKYTTPETSVEGDAFFDTYGFTGEGLSLAELEELGQTLLDQYGAGEANGARGLGIKVGVVEHTAYVTGPKVSEGGTLWHEDLEDVIPEPNQTIITISGGVLNPDHGTATLGEIVAADNGFGVTGIARDAQGYFFPIVSVEEGGRTLNAIATAMQTFDAGDVLNYSIGPGGGGTLVSQEGPWILIRLGSDLGITSCISAGNDCFNLDDNGQANGQDSGAIIVGACWPGAPATPPLGLGRYCRLGFSNHCQACDPTSLVHVSAWGIDVTTCGGGDLFAPPIPGSNPPEIDHARTYTGTFNGTSSAAPIISGLAACLQGLAKQFYGTSLTPESLRNVISGNVFPQCEVPAGALPGSEEPFQCGGDFNPDAPARLIGGFPQAFEGGIGVIAGNFFSASPAVDYKVVTGTQLSGNLNSIKAPDNQFLVIKARQLGSGGTGQGYGPPITYLVGGYTTDIEVTMFTTLEPAQVSVLGVESISNTTQDFVLVAQYVYNWDSNRWTLLPTIDFTGPAGIDLQNLVNKPESHVSTDGVIYVRVWTCGLGAVPQYNTRHDYITILLSPDPTFDPFGG
ncbi:MAG: S8 family serine peptidase [Phycisphaerales bacterium]|nr:S8 family serine peptidase [Phycisphaerales bacterium]